MTIRCDNRATPADLAKLGLARGARTGPDQVGNRVLKGPAGSLARDDARPWLFGILRFFDYRGKLGPEDKISAAFYDRLRAASAEGRFSGVYVHCANEGKRSKAAGAHLRRIGMVPGAPDWWFMGPWGHGTIELKAPKGRKTADELLTEAQREFAAWCRYEGVPHAACMCVDEAWDVLKGWGAVRG